MNIEIFIVLDVAKTRIKAKSVSSSVDYYARCPLKKYQSSLIPLSRAYALVQDTMGYYIILSLLLDWEAEGEAKHATKCLAVRVHNGKEGLSKSV